MPELLSEAVSYHRAGNTAQAGELYQRILRRDPTHAEAWHLLGVLASQSGRHEVAVDYIGKAIRSNPLFPDAHNNLGNAHKVLGRLDEALGCYRRAIALEPDFAVAHNNMGNLFRSQGNYELAIEAYGRAIAVEPDYFEALYNLSVSLIDLGRYREAEEASRRAIGTAPQFAPAHVSLSVSLTGQKKHRQATKWLKKAFELDPDNLEVLRAFGAQFEERGEPEKAAACYLQVLALGPDHKETLSRLVDIVLSLCDWEHYDEFSRMLLDAARQEIESGNPVTADIFNLLALPISNDLIFEAARNKAGFVARRMASARARRPFAFPSPPEAKDGIRLGYLLPYTEKHSMPLVLKGVIERHDRARFEVYGYAIRQCDGSAFSKAFRKAFDRFLDVPRASPEAAACRIYHDAIDLLIDTTGHTAINCLEIAAMKPAPVQVHYLGYSLTTGSDFVDYLITDRTFMPPEWKAYCSEKLVYLPDSFMATARAAISRKRPKRADFGLPEDGFVFCNFNHPCKLEPAIFSVWMRLLERTPKSVLWLGGWMKPTRRNLCRQAEARGIAGERLIFADIVRHPLHLARLRLADLALDNRHHGGGITTVDALWCGLPVLTIAGQTPPSRLGATLSGAAGVPELVTSSLEEYERTGLELGRHPEKLAAIRRKLLSRRRTSPLFDTDRYTRHLDAAYEEMWRIHAANEPPRHIEVQALPGA